MELLVSDEPFKFVACGSKLDIACMARKLYCPGKILASPEAEPAGASSLVHEDPNA